MDFPAVEYTAVSGENNTFKRPRQKMYGVFIISSVIETKGTTITLNYGALKPLTGYFYLSTDGTMNAVPSTNLRLQTSAYNPHYIVSSYNESYIPPEGLKVPTGETITKSSRNIILDTSTSIGSKGGDPVYKASDVKSVSLYTYVPIIRNTGWDLVSTTNDLYQAKEMVNNWLRYPPEIPTDARPKSGMNSVIICEILPADSIVEL